MKIVSKHLDASPGDIIVGGGFYHTCILLEKTKCGKNTIILTWLKSNGTIFTTTNLVIGN